LTIPAVSDSYIGASELSGRIVLAIYHFIPIIPALESDAHLTNNLNEKGQ
jgi:hypothetical protein